MLDRQRLPQYMRNNDEVEKHNRSNNLGDRIPSSGEGEMTVALQLSRVRDKVFFSMPSYVQKIA